MFRRCTCASFPIDGGLKILGLKGLHEARVFASLSVMDSSSFSDPAVKNVHVIPDDCIHDEADRGTSPKLMKQEILF